MRPAPGMFKPQVRTRKHRSALEVVSFRISRVWRSLKGHRLAALTIVAAVVVGVSIAVAIIAASEGIDTKIDSVLDTRGLNIAAVKEVTSQARRLLRKLAIGFTATTVLVVTGVILGQRRSEIGIEKMEGQRSSAIMIELVIELFILCIVGGAIGIGSGLALCRLISTQIPALPMSPSVEGMLAIFPITILFTLVGTALIAAYYAWLDDPDPN